MDSNKTVPKPKAPKPPQSELSKIARDYNSLLWQLKGNTRSVKTLAYRLPTHKGKGVLLVADTAPFQTPPQQLAHKLSEALVNAADQLEYCEYLTRQLSESHREAHKYTMKLIQEKENGDD